MKPEVSPPEQEDRDTGSLDAAAWVELEVPETPSERDQAFRLLARWLLSAARKGAPVADSGPVEGSQNRLDVAPGAKVGSDGR